MRVKWLYWYWVSMLNTILFHFRNHLRSHTHKKNKKKHECAYVMAIHVLNCILTSTSVNKKQIVYSGRLLSYRKYHERDSWIMRLWLQNIVSSCFASLFHHCILNVFLCLSKFKQYKSSPSTYKLEYSDIVMHTHICQWTLKTLINGVCVIISSCPDVNTENSVSLNIFTYHPWRSFPKDLSSVTTNAVCLCINGHNI